MVRPSRTAEASWVEDSVSFNGTIRRSGNSLIITVPSELAKRFLISEGQEVLIVGLTRKLFNFEGMIGIYLGNFKVKENIYGISFDIEVGEEKVGIEDFPFIQAIADKYGATGVALLRDERRVNIRMLFGCIREVVLKPKTKEDVEKIMRDLTYEAQKAGVELRDLKVFEEEVEWNNIDPAMLARTQIKDSDRVKWRWEL